MIAPAFPLVVASGFFYFIISLTMISYFAYPLTYDLFSSASMSYHTAIHDVVRANLCVAVTKTDFGIRETTKTSYSKYTVCFTCASFSLT